MGAAPGPTDDITSVRETRPHVAERPFGARWPSTMVPIAADTGSERLKLLLALLLDLGYLLAGVASLPWFAYRLARRGDALGFLSRFGIGLGTGRPSPIWLHGASAGEVLLLQTLVHRLERDLPEVPIVVSAFSSTGLAAARRAFPRHRVVFFPFDLSLVVNRFLCRLRPRLVVIAEADLWPNFLLALRRRDVPAVVLNGRMSPRSCRRHALTRIVPSLMRAMPLIAVQAEEHARRLQRLGVEARRLHVTGNMKYDLAPPPWGSGEVRALREKLGYRARDVVIIGGSLHRGEDEALLRAFERLSRETRGPVALALVPRYPSDAAGVEQKAREHGFDAFRKTAVDGGEEAPGAGGVLIVDTLGELRALYAAADIAFVGGSLFSRGRERGGHNLMEPAISGVPVLFGTPPCELRRDRGSTGGGRRGRGGPRLGGARPAPAAARRGRSGTPADGGEGEGRNREPPGRDGEELRPPAAAAGIAEVSARWKAPSTPASGL